MQAKLAFALVSLAVAAAQPRSIDTRDSILTVHADKAGLFSAFGHDHEIRAPISGGSVDTSAQRVELRVGAANLRVIDPKASEKDRAEIQKTMLGPEVLDVERFPEIAFRSQSVSPAGANSWKVRGDLTVHGQTRPVTVEVTEASGHFTGRAAFKQSEFGIKPVRVAGGTVKVKDELRIDFDLRLAP